MRPGPSSPDPGPHGDADPRPYVDGRPAGGLSDVLQNGDEGCQSGPRHAHHPTQGLELPLKVGDVSFQTSRARCDVSFGGEMVQCSFHPGKTFFYGGHRLFSHLAAAVLVRLSRCLRRCNFIFFVDWTQCQLFVYAPKPATTSCHSPYTAMMWYPASTGIMEPVIPDASSLHRNSAAAATSSLVMLRLRGAFSWCIFFISRNP